MIPSGTRHLRRLWRSIPLLKLTQGSSLSIRSNLPRPVNLLIQSGWRNDGLVEFQQVLQPGQEKEPHCDVVVTHETDRLTSLGRSEGHISILLRQQTEADHAASFQTIDESLPVGYDELHGVHGSPVASKRAEKVLRDDDTMPREAPDPTAEDPSLRRVAYGDGVVHVVTSETTTAAATRPKDPPGIYLTVQVPEKLNLEVALVPGGGGSIAVQGKLEGDARLSTSDGDISVTKLRGHVVDLSATGTVRAAELLEAQTLTVNTRGRLRAKQIHGRSVRIAVDKSTTTNEISTNITPSGDTDDEGSLVDISSLFVSGGGGATIAVEGNGFRQPKRAVRVKSHHGPLQVTVSGLSQPNRREARRDDGSLFPLVELGGVNGSGEVIIDSTVASEDNDTGDWISCQCHVDSLSPESVSLLSVDKGDIELTLDRKVETDLRLLALASHSYRAEAAALLTEEDDEDLLGSVLSHLKTDERSTSGSAMEANDKVLIDTEAFTAERSQHTNSLTYASGWVENKSHEPDSRFEQKQRGSLGKIRIDSAANQALHGFVDSRDEAKDENVRPLIAAVTTGRILVESLSWIGAIARRYGLTEDGRDLGRTASRGGRRLFPPSNE